MTARRVSQPRPRLEDVLARHILVLDGATATMLQNHARGGTIDPANQPR